VAIADFVAWSFCNLAAASSGPCQSGSSFVWRWHHLREIHFRLVDVVEVVGENVHRDVGDDFDNLTIAVSGLPYCVELHYGDVAPALHDVASKLQRRIDAVLAG
jgi:hypothetical protein